MATSKRLNHKESMSRNTARKAQRRDPTGNEPMVYLDPKNPRTPRKQHIQPKNHNQKLLLEAIRNFPIVVSLGPAGTGKTYCSTSQMVNEYLSGGYDKIVLTRANIATGKSLGFFPGTVQEKMAPWLLPITQVLEKQFSKHYYQYLVSKEIIEIQPLETIRGRSYENSLIIVDECQNLVLDEIKAITTRLGENSKMVLCGDFTQSDLGNASGIKPFVNMCIRNGIEIPIIEFDVNDIVRSDMVGKLIRMFINEGI